MKATHRNVSFFLFIKIPVKITRTSNYKNSNVLKTNLNKNYFELKTPNLLPEEQLVELDLLGQATLFHPFLAIVLPNTSSHNNPLIPRANHSHFLTINFTFFNIK
jgi:hypothetical protein